MCPLVQDSFFFLEHDVELRIILLLVQQHSELYVFLGLLLVFCLLVVWLASYLNYYFVLN